MSKRGKSIGNEIDVIIEEANYNYDSDNESF